MTPVSVWTRSDERGLALPLTLFVLAVLALLTAVLAGTTTAEVGSERLADWDRRALYAAEAGVEHQIFELKANPLAGPVGPVSMGGSPLEVRYQVTGLTPVVPPVGFGPCPGLGPQWEITGVGQLWQGAVRVHERQVGARVEIRPTPTLQVTVCRWR